MEKLVDFDETQLEEVIKKLRKGINMYNLKGLTIDDKKNNVKSYIKTKKVLTHIIKDLKTAQHILTALKIYDMKTYTKEDFFDYLRKNITNSRKKIL